MYSRYGLNFGAIVDMPVEVGISRVLGMKMFRAGNVQDYQVKALHAVDRLQELDAMYIHIKGPDEFGHDGDWQGKKNNIEAIDRLFFGPLVDRRDIEDTLIVVSGDHSTPCIKNSHSDDPVPVLFSGCSVKSDGSERFTEYWGRKGKLGLILGDQILNQILTYRSKNNAY
jgi:2,3-bisphosphoglycerate-independent phosphoglycerate mutase